MRYLPIIIALFSSALAGEAAYPLWDGSESVAEYAKKVKLPATKTLDLGNGAQMELVLIPAGKFVMGTPPPTPVDDEGFHRKIITGLAFLAISATALLVMLAVIIILAIRKRQRPKYSLLWFLLMIVMAGGCVLSGLHWQQSVRGLGTAKGEYAAAKATYDANPDEHPAHPVALTTPYYMGKFPVTQEQYQQLIGANPSQFKGKDNPVDNVSWNGAEAFCNKLTANSKQRIRMPTEAEWEYACRAGTTTTYYSGNTEADLARVAWCSVNSSMATHPHPVGQKEPNTFGLYDMHGNICQWCEDWYGEGYYQKSETENPQGPTQGTFRLLRGGSWGSVPMECRSAFHYVCFPNGTEYIGFRVAAPVVRTP